MSAEAGGVSPKDVAGVAVIGGEGAEHVLPAEVGDLDEAVLHGLGVLALNLCN